MKKIISALIVSAALLTGCASVNKVTEEKHSGFLSDYSIMKPIEEDPGRLGYLNPEVNWHQYNSIMVDKVLIITPDGEQQTDAKILVAIADKYEEVLKQKLSTKFNVVENAGAGTIRFQAAITSVFTSYDDMKGYQYIPIAAAFTGAKRASGSEQQRVRVMTEVKLHDSVDGQLLGQSIDLKSGDRKQDKNSGILLADVVPILERWAQSATNILVGLRENIKN
ncbi:MAG: DUF3313 domain-containing protein [Proteobacteria bacterium]|nr:DUF3313 domain-containing protein [Pseudomonadota bacterium]